MEASYHERYSEDDIEDNPSTNPLDNETARNPQSRLRHNAEGRLPYHLEDSTRAECQINPRTQTQTEVSHRQGKPRALEPSWINAEPIDEFIREIGDFIIRATKGRTNVEVEAKIGVLIDTRTNQRLNLPAVSEIILAENYPDLRFEANMSQEQHAHFNRLLNERVKITNTSTYPYAKIGCSHSKVVDSFHSSGTSGNKLRLTVDERTGNVKASVIKERIANINVYCPRRKVDWRVSVNTETPVPPPVGPPIYSRRKDRMTYTHQAFQIDLTQVNATSESAKTQHELEVEFRDAEEMMQLASLREHDWAFDELVRIFVNNVRILVRNSP